MTHTTHHSHERAQPANLNLLPKAGIQDNWKTWLFWLAPFVAAGLAAWFAYDALVRRGPTLHIYFDNGREIQAGQTQVYYRGTAVGIVKKIELTKDHGKVRVTVSLEGFAESLARQGSRFWIVRPHLGVAQIQAPRTIVSGNYIAVDPGSGRKATEFQGLSRAPAELSHDYLRIVLLTDHLGSLRPHAPVAYRDVQVGEVVQCDLADDAQTIRVFCDIQHRYEPLVRMNSVFWNAGGINVNLSLSGLSVSAESAQSLLSGGIAFATPGVQTPQAAPNTAFRIYDKPEKAWLDWAPAIHLNPTNEADTVESP